MVDYYQAPPPQYQAPPQYQSPPQYQMPYGAPTKLPGAAMLKVVGVILIVFSALSLAASLVSLYYARNWVTMFLEDPLIAALAPEISSMTMASTILAIAIAAVMLVCSIFGVKYCNVKGKAQLLFILSIVMIALQVAGFVFNNVVIASMYAAFYGSLSIPYSSSASNYIIYIVSLLLSALFLIGAIQNKKA
ncbi:MAG: hypothetical protein LBR44_03180 [Clostridiales Family XIII bacterium]|jgi:hypothetical protein|nr:hypothetical protein [Clostridiales Family XIII bacterium]